MSNPLSLTASHYALADDGSPASLLARALQATELELGAMQEKYRATKAHANQLVHENERLREQVKPAKIWPVHIRCDGKGCHSVVAFDPAPEEARITEALIALEWRFGETKHYCGGCR